MPLPHLTRTAIRCLAVGASLTCLNLSGAEQSITPSARVLAEAPRSLLDRLRQDPYSYFRFVNREWTVRVCDMFAADLPSQPIGQLHGDAHLEQYALTKTAWGLDDFDDSARGPALVDVVRFLGSIDLATRQRGWRQEDDRMFDVFFAGYRRGLADQLYEPQEPAIVRRLRADMRHTSPRAYLAAEKAITPMSDASMKGVIAAMSVFSRIVLASRTDLHADYFTIVRAGWFRVGVGSGMTRKVLIRVQGRSNDPEDDELLEAKALDAFEGHGCVVDSETQPGLRILLGNEQIGRIKHNILVAGPDLVIPEVSSEAKNLRDWWIHSWEPSYRELRVSDFHSVDDLAAIVFDSAVQLGAGSVHGFGGPELSIQRVRALQAITAIEPRLRTAARQLALEVLQGWADFRKRTALPKPS
jgi:Uncharacterized protein conserved in bacteria (DUF2252)